MREIHFFFGFFVKYGYQLLFKCISDKFQCFGMGSKWFQIGYLGINVPNSMILCDIELICKKHGYCFCLVDQLNWGVKEYEIDCINDK